MRILVVEDVHELRRHIVRMLEALGHEAYGVGGAWPPPREAMLLELDAVFCDVDFAGGDWLKACRGLMTNEPGLAVVIVTGNEGNLALARRAALRPILRKPFAAAELRGLVREIDRRRRVGEPSRTWSRASQFMRAVFPVAAALLRVARNGTY